MVGLTNQEDEHEVVNSSLTHVRAQESRWEQNRRLFVDFETRTVWVEGEVESGFGCWFQSIMWELVRLDDKAPVTIWLCTPGGDVTSSYQFYDFIRSAPFEVTIIGHGEVASAGVLMLACGHKRYATENCVVMAHEYRGGMGQGELKASEARDRRDFEDWMTDSWFELMARHTKHDAEFWKKKQTKKAEFWLLGAKAIIDIGIVDAVYDPYNKLVGVPLVTPKDEVRP